LVNAAFEIIMSDGESGGARKCSKCGDEFKDEVASLQAEVAHLRKQLETADPNPQPTHHAELLVNQKGLAGAISFWGEVKKGLDDKLASSMQAQQPNSVAPSSLKRPSTEPHAEEAAAKRPANQIQTEYMKGDLIDSNDTVVMLLVPSSMVGPLIGSKGCEIKRMTAVSNCKMRLESINEPSSAHLPEPLRKMTISGTVAGCHLAVLEAYAILFQRNGTVGTMKILIPNQAAGVIIGKGGSMVKSLQTLSGAHVSVEKEMGYGAVGREVHVDSETVESSGRAQYEISRVMHSWQARQELVGDPSAFQGAGQGGGVGWGGGGKGGKGMMQPQAMQQRARLPNTMGMSAAGLPFAMSSAQQWRGPAPPPPQAPPPAPPQAWGNPHPPPPGGPPRRW
jgi:transcription antitermination factor NusA-like protein